MDQLTHQEGDRHAGHKMAEAHASHDRHAGHSVAMFRDNFGLFLRRKPPKGAAI
jgi:P-type Cu2+ transporter